MNKDQVAGRAEEAKGKVKEVAGKAVNNDRLKTEGQMEQAAGNAQKQMGDAKETVKKSVDRS